MKRQLYVSQYRFGSRLKAAARASGQVLVLGIIVATATEMAYQFIQAY